MGKERNLTRNSTHRGGCACSGPWDATRHCANVSPSMTGPGTVPPCAPRLAVLYPRHFQFLTYLFITRVLWFLVLLEVHGPPTIVSGQRYRQTTGHRFRLDEIFMDRNCWDGKKCLSAAGACGHLPRDGGGGRL